MHWRIYFIRFSLLLSLMGGLQGCSWPGASKSGTSSHLFAQEYDESAYLGAINAQVAYDKGATGKGVIVSVIDSGIDASNSELSGQVNPNGADYVGIPAQVNTDTNGHGTHIAGLIAAKRDGEGIHGVAYDATLLSYRIAFENENFSVKNPIIKAFQSALSNQSYIYNNSWSSYDVPNPNENLTSANLLFYFPYLNQIRTNINQGGVFVWAAGNEGQTEVTLDAALPLYDVDLKPGWLAVAWADKANRIHAKSNRCGSAAAWCITAPGSTDGIWINDRYVTAQGSSMAAGVVSGSLAVLLSHFGSSEFNAQDAAARLLATANKSGVYAIEAIYGQGFLDLGAAIQPVGQLSLASGATLLSPTQYPLKLSGIQLPAGVNQQVLLDALPESFIAVDSFQSVPFRVFSKDFFNFSNAPALASAPTNHGLLDPQPKHTLAQHENWQLYLQPDANLASTNLLNLRWQAPQQAWYGEAGYTFAPNTQDSKSQLAVGFDIAGFNIYNQYQYAPTNLFGLQGRGAFTQPSGNLNKLGIDWNIFTNSEMGLTLGYNHTQFNPQAIEAAWQWQPQNQLASWRLDYATKKHKDKPYTWGVWWQQDEYLGDTAATLTLPTQLTDINLGYETVPIKGDWLFNRQHLGIFWQWHMLPSQQLSADLLWHQQGNDWRSSLALEWSNNGLNQ